MTSPCCTPAVEREALPFPLVAVLLTRVYKALPSLLNSKRSVGDGSIFKRATAKSHNWDSVVVLGERLIDSVWDDSRQVKVMDISFCMMWMDGSVMGWEYILEGWGMES